MLWLSLFISFILGFSIITAISSKFSYLEKLGSSFLLGIGFQVIWMIIFDFAGIKISLSSIYAASIVSIIFLWVYLIFIKKTLLLAIIWPYDPFKKIEWTKINLPWVVAMLFIGYTLWAITVKCLFWPTFEFDSVAGYDLVAKVVAAEGTFDNSIFMSNGVSFFNTAHRTIYPPLVSGSFAYAYMSGAEMSKVISALYYLSFIVLIYALIRRAGLGHFGTAFTVILILYIPELTSHAALSQTNMPQAVYTATGLMSLYLWMSNKEKNAHFFYLSMFLMAANSIIRTENIVFGFVAGLAVLIDTLRKVDRKKIINLFVYGAVILTPFIMWSLFLKINNLKPATEASNLAFEITYDPIKFKQWWILLWGYEEFPRELLNLTPKLNPNDFDKSGIVFNQSFYALVPYLFLFFAIIAAIYHVVKISMSSGNVEKLRLNKTALNKDFYLLYISLVPFLLYTVFFYFVKYDWDSIRNVMLFSYKRGLFGVMVLASLFVCLSSPVKDFFGWIDRIMYGNK
jgi:hypothetical protein